MAIGYRFKDLRAGVVYDRTESYALVFSTITVALVISAALTARTEQESRDAKV